MKILYVISGIGTTGASGSDYIQNSIFKIAKNFPENQITLLSPIYIHTRSDIYSWRKKVESEHHIKITLVDAPPWLKKHYVFHLLLTPIITTFSLASLLRHNNYDILHEFTSSPFISLRTMAFGRLYKLKAVVSLSVFNKTLFGKIFWFKLFKGINRIILPSKDLANVLYSQGIPKNKIVFIPPGIDVNKFKKNIDQELAIKKLGLNPGKFIFTYFGPLTKEKGVFDILGALDLISPKTRKNCKFYFFSFYSRRFNYAINSLNREDIILREELIDIPTLCSASSCILLPQQSGHGTTIPPISVIEVLLSGKALIATNIIGTREVISTKKNAILVPTASPKQLAKAIDRVYKERSKFTREDRDMEYFKVYSENNFVDKHIALYRQLSKERVL